MFFKPFEMPTGATIRQKDYHIEDFGAVPGGEVKNTEAFKKAIDTAAAEGGGRIIIPAGKWLTGPIHFKDGIELHLEKDAYVMFSTDKEDYLPAVFTLYEGMRCYTYSAQLYANGCHDIAITGEGTFDGQGFVWWWMIAVHPEGVQDIHDAAEEHRPMEQRVYNTVEQGIRPGLLHFIDCKNILIEGCTFRFSPFWTVHPTWCENIIIKNIRVVNPHDHAPNTDGCNFEGCVRGLLDGIYVDTGDDAVCLKAGRDEDGRLMARPCKDIVIRNIVANRCHGGITIGSEMSGGVENIYVENCKFLRNFMGIWIKTAPERGGYVRNIEYHNVEIEHLWREGIMFTMGYYCDDYTPDEYPHMPTIENILVDGFSCKKSSVAVKLEGHDQSHLKNIHLRNAKAKGGINIQVDRVDGLNMENVSFA